MILLAQLLVCFLIAVSGELDTEDVGNEYIEVPRIKAKYGAVSVNESVSTVDVGSEYIEVPRIKAKCGVGCYPDLIGLNIKSKVEDDEGETIFSFDEFPTVETVFRYMSYLASKYKERIQVLDIGTTEERLPIKVLRIGSQNLNSTVWVDGGIHAREWISITSVCFIMYLLAEHWSKFSLAVQNTEFFLLPLMNPDGYRYSYTKSRMWRKNRRYTAAGGCYGVDLNRNFPYKWGTTHILIKDGLLQQKKPCNEIYEGAAPLSEPESRSLVQFIQNSGRNFQAFLTFHSYGHRINYPYGYEPRVPKEASLMNYVALKAKYKISNATKIDYNVAPLSMTDYVSPGNSIDWAYRTNNILFSYLIELSHDNFIVPASEIIPTGKEAFIIVKTVVDNLYMSDEEMSVIPPVEIFDEVIQEN